MIDSTKQLIILFGTYKNANSNFLSHHVYIAVILKIPNSDIGYTYMLDVHFTAYIMSDLLTLPQTSKYLR